MLPRSRAHTHTHEEEEEEEEQKGDGEQGATEGAERTRTEDRGPLPWQLVLWRRRTNQWGRLIKTTPPHTHKHTPSPR